MDDETAIRLLVGYILRSLGHQVELHASSDELFAKLAHAPADLVITDFIMPRIDGFELCRRLRADAKTAKVPIIVMTGFELEPLVADSLKNGLSVSDILPKPFFAERLIDMVTRSTKQAQTIEPVTDLALDDVSEARIAKAIRAVGQRLQPRIEAKINVSITWEQQALTAFTSDVSTTGLYIVGERCPPPNADVTVAVAAFEGKAPVVLHAVVAHVRQLDDGAYGFGLALQEPRVQSFYAWYQLIARLHQVDRTAHQAVRRTTTRAPIMGEVRVDVDASQSVLCALGDISAGGMRLFGETPLPPEAPLTIHFQLPEDAGARKTRARVRWMQKQAPGRLVYGLAFEETDDTVADAIARYVNDLASRPLLEI
ncbi:MAG: response regulator [Deltaproteobacteria bacterium]|nr:response regulator [Deltaproteobacteria bacterium]